MAKKKREPARPKPEVISFDSAPKFRSWLRRNSSRTEGIWLKFFKRNSGVKTIKYAEALDEALCFGWIDGQARTIDDQAYAQKFTPRRKSSLWSKRNIGLAERLIAEKKMTPRGLQEIEAAKADGRWERAYDSPSKSKIPDDFLKALKKNKKAEAFFKTLNKTNLYSIAWRLQTAAKPETREKRMKAILEMLALEKKFHG